MKVVSIKLTATLKGQLVAHLRFDDSSNVKMLIGGPHWDRLTPPLRSAVINEADTYLRGLVIQLTKVGSL